MDMIFIDPDENILMAMAKTKHGNGRRFKYLEDVPLPTFPVMAEDASPDRRPINLIGTLYTLFVNTRLYDPATNAIFIVTKTTTCLESVAVKLFPYTGAKKSSSKKGHKLFILPPAILEEKWENK